MVVRPDRLLSSSALVVTCILASFSSAKAATNSAPSTSGVTRTIIDRVPSVETIGLVNKIFERARRLTVYYTPESQMGRLGFDLKMAREMARFEVSISCRGSCGNEFSRFRDSLATGLRIRGDCVGPIGTVIDLRDESGVMITSIAGTSEGQCFTIEGQSYFVEETYIRKELEALTSMLK